MALKRSLAWMGLAQITALALQFTSSVVLARLLTPYEMGIYAVSAATVGVLAVVQAFGLQALIVREEFLTTEITATAFTLNLFIALGLSAAIASLSVAGGAFLHDAAVQRVLLVLSINPLFSIFDLLPTANLERRGKFRTMSLVTTTSGIAGTILTIVLAFKGFKYMSLVYSGIVSAAISTILMNIAGRQHVSFRMGLKAWRRVANFGLQMLAVSGVNSISTRLSDVLLGRLQGLSALGIYNRAGSLNGLIWSNVHLVAGRVVFVDYAELNRQKVSLRGRYLRTVEIITALLWPAFGGFAILSGPFILMVYGAKWLPATVPLAFLAIASMIQVSITMTWELFAATGQLKAQTRIEFVRAGVALACFGAGCLISMTVAAAARIVDAAFAVFLYRKHLDRMTDTALADFLPIYRQSAILTLLALIPPAALMATFRMSARTPMMLVIGSVVLGIALWAAGLSYFKHPLMHEAKLSMERFARNRRVNSNV
ncbi:MAG: oligosaccharide flippase family protein [Acidobacteriaceae bacterium]